MKFKKCLKTYLFGNAYDLDSLTITPQYEVLAHLIVKRPLEYSPFYKRLTRGPWATGQEAKQKTRNGR